MLLVWDIGNLPFAVGAPPEIVAAVPDLSIKLCRLAGAAWGMRLVQGPAVDGAGVVQVPETARGNAARAAIRARLAESSKSNDVTGNGGAPGRGPVGGGTSDNGAAPAKDRGRRGDVAGPDTPAATPEDEAGSAVTHASGSGGWSPDAADTLPPHGGDRAVPPWEAESAAPPEPASPVTSWDSGAAAPPSGAGSLAAGRSLPPWELPPEARSAVPPWVAGHPAPPSAAGRSVPPWELAGPDVDATGPAPVPPWPGQAASPAEALDGPGNSHAVPPWPPAARPRPPVAPPWPPASPPWP